MVASGSLPIWLLGVLTNMVARGVLTNMVARGSLPIWLLGGPYQYGC